MRRQPHLPPPASPPARGAFTLIEVLMVVLIMGICATIGLDAISASDANQRAERSAREVLAAFRFARNLAINTGKKAQVVISTSSATASVYWMSNGSTWDPAPLTSNMSPTGQWVVNLATSPEMRGTAISISPAINTFIYGTTGTCSATATITFNYGFRTRSLIVSAVGDPQIQ